MVLKYIYTVSLLLSLLISGKLSAVQSAADIQAMSEIGDQIAEWWNSLPQEKPLSISVLDVAGDKGLTEDFLRISDEIVLASFAKNKTMRAIPCFECRTPKVVVKDSRIMVTKGVPNLASMQEIARKLEVESFATVYIIKTFQTLQAEVIVYSSGTSSIFASKKFKVTNVMLNDSRMHFMVSTGLQWDRVPKENRDPTKLPFAVELGWLQTIGQYSRFGLTLGGLFAGGTGNALYITPKMQWKFQLGRSAVSILPGFQSGFGLRVPGSLGGIFGGGTSLGLVGGASVDVMFGDFFYFGPKIDAFLPMNENDYSRFTYYPGFHLGISVGG